MALTQLTPDLACHGTAHCEPQLARTVVWLRGEHDIATRAGLSYTLAGAIAAGQNDLVVDLSCVGFFDASTIGVLVAEVDPATPQPKVTSGAPLERKGA